MSGLIDECICIKASDKHGVPYIKLLVVADDAGGDTSKKLLQYIRSKVEAYKLPREIEFVDGIKKTFNGKIDRKAYQEESPDAVP